MTQPTIAETLAKDLEFTLETRSILTLNEIDSIIDRLSKGASIPGNPKSTILGVLREYQSVVKKEDNASSTFFVGDINIILEPEGYSQEQKIERFISNIYTSSKPFKDASELGIFYEIISGAIRNASLSSLSYDLCIGNEEKKLPVENTERIRRLALTIGSEIDFANKADKSDSVKDYLFGLKEIIETANVVRHDESIRLAEYMAPRFRYCQHDGDFFREQTRKLIEFENTFSGIGTR